MNTVDRRTECRLITGNIIGKCKVLSDIAFSLGIRAITDKDSDIEKLYQVVKSVDERLGKIVFDPPEIPEK